MRNTTYLTIFRVDKNATIGCVARARKITRTTTTTTTTTTQEQEQEQQQQQQQQQEQEHEQEQQQQQQQEQEQEQQQEQQQEEQEQNCDQKMCGTMATSCGMTRTSHCALHLRAPAEHVNNTNARTTIHSPYGIAGVRSSTIQNGCALLLGVSQILFHAHIEGQTSVHCAPIRLGGRVPIFQVGVQGSLGTFYRHWQPHPSLSFLQAFGFTVLEDLKT